jgi:hypothetical protein
VGARAIHLCAASAHLGESPGRQPPLAQFLVGQLCQHHVGGYAFAMGFAPQQLSNCRKRNAAKEVPCATPDPFDHVPPSQPGHASFHQGRNLAIDRADVANVFVVLEYLSHWRGPCVQSAWTFARAHSRRRRAGTSADAMTARLPSRRKEGQAAGVTGKALSLYRPGNSPERRSFRQGCPCFGLRRCMAIPAPITSPWSVLGGDLVDAPDVSIAIDVVILLFPGPAAGGRWRSLRAAVTSTTSRTRVSGRCCFAVALSLPFSLEAAFSCLRVSSCAGPWSSPFSASRDALLLSCVRARGLPCRASILSCAPRRAFLLWPFAASYKMRSIFPSNAT